MEPLPMPTPAPVTPGWQTSEFWLTSVAQVVALAVALGWLGPDDSNAVSSATSKVVMGVFATVALFKYAYTRWQLKTSAMESVQSVAIANAQVARAQTLMRSEK